MRFRCALFVALWVASASARGEAISASSLPTALRVSPAEVTLVGPDSVQQLLVTGMPGDDRMRDYSRRVVYESSDAAVATVSAEGVITPRGNGQAEVRIRLGDATAAVAVTVTDIAVMPPVSFSNQVLPIFTKAGCNAGGCHGKSSGQNGFKLSLLGFDARYDYDAIVKEARGRRVFPARPEQSLLVLKATAAVPHAGGRKIEPDSLEYGRLVRWIAQGTPPGSVRDPAVVRIECTPRAAALDRQAEQQVLVTAFYSDGSHRDVTAETQFKSNEPEVAQVDGRGLVRTDVSTGETTVMARYMGRIDVCRITIPLPASASASTWPEVPVRNFVDELVQAKWKALNLVPSPLADDSAFLRRAFLDAIGTLPTPDEVRAFVADPSSQKRSEWIDKILARGEYADYWAITWGDLLRNQRKGQRENQRGTFAFHAWIRNALATNMPYDQFVRSIIAAQGTVDQHPPVIWYRTVRNPTHQTNDTAQLFLGTRINCAQCHNHPYEKWTQNDYYRFQAFFGRLGKKSGESSAEPAIYVKPDGGGARHPTSGELMTPHGLDGPEVVSSEDQDPRQGLVDWMAAPDNPYFARALANRLWAHFMSRGLVEPIDDMRITNPPSNAELLDALARDFVAHKFDVKHLIRTIMDSSAYQLSSEPAEGNAQDRQNYARAYPRRLSAEVMLDAIDQVTGTTEDFSGLPRGMRTIALPDESVGSYFLDVFGRPARETACECERPREANLAQALHLLNSSDIQNKVGAPPGRLAGLLKAKASDAVIADELYLAALGRSPKESEARAVLDYVAKQPDRKVGFEDAFWAILNTKEFLFNH